MNVLGAILTGLAIIAAGLGSFARESLRCFSRSRLDDACRRLRRPERFGVILKRSTDAFLAAEFFAAAALIVLVAIAAVRFTAELGDSNDALDRATVLVESVVVLAGLLLAFFVIPWSLSRVAGERFVARAWPAIEIAARLVRPYVVVARRVDRFMHRLWGLPDQGGSSPDALTDEIRCVVDQGQREGVLTTQTRRMIDRAIELQQEDVAAVMTPRTDMDCIPADASLGEARRMMLEAGHSRMPVIGASTDDIVGILYAKDLLQQLASDDRDAPSLKDIVREPVYIPETTGVDKLLENMKRRGVHIAIVVDEYSGVSGLVTMEDVLEQIVGDIVDEYDSAEDSGIRQIAPGNLEVAAWVRIDDLHEQFGFDLPEDEDYDTIGGFIYAQLGRIPKKRDALVWKQLRLTVLDADRRRIHKIHIETLHSPASLSTDQR